MTTPSARNSTAAPKCRWLLLLLLPAAFFCLALYIEKIKGPFYLCRNSDPDYVYLYSSLTLAQGHAPQFSDHPGTTVIGWGALVLRAAHLIAGRGDFVQDVLQRPEFYLTEISLSLMAVQAIGLFFLGRAAWRAFGRWEFALLAQGAVMAFPEMAQYSPRVNADAAVIIVCQWLGIVLLRQIYGPRDSANGRNSALLFGAVTGAAIATKLTFAPVVLLGLLLFETWKARGYFLAAAVGFIALLTLPVASRWGLMTSWFWQILTHRDLYGTGAVGFPDIMTCLRWIKNFLMDSPIYTLLSAGMLGVVAWYWLVGRKQPDSTPRWLGRALTALLVFHEVTLLMVAKHPRERYLYPSFGLMMVTVLIAADLLRRGRLRSLPRAVRAAGWGLVALLLIWSSWSGLTAVFRYLDAEVPPDTAVAEIVESLSAKHLIVRGTWSSSPAYAAYFGNSYSPENLYTAQLARLYPDFVSLDVGARKFVSFDRVLGDETAADTLFPGREGVILQLGLPVYLDYSPLTLPTGYKLYPLLNRAPGESLYWLGQGPSSAEFLNLKKELAALLAARPDLRAALTTP